MASVRSRTNAKGQTSHAVLYRLGDRQTSKTFTTKKQAEKFRALVEILGPTRALAELAGQEADGLTVNQLAAEFFDWKKRDVTPRTDADYRRDYKNWIEPAFGTRRASSIDELDVQQFVDNMSKRLEPKSVADKHMLLHSMFKFGAAKSRRLVDHNPCLETQLPKRRKKAPKGATLAEWYAMRAAAREIEPDAADLMEFIAGTGWRWSEAAALQVRSVEEYPDENGVMHMYAVMGAVWRKDADNRQALEIDGAKSDAGRRRIKVPAHAADIIRRRTVGKGLDDLVFTNAAGRKWYQQNFLNRTWTRILDHAALERRVTPHFLRHTHVAILDKAGVSMPEIQRRLGHESIETTFNVYGGMIDNISDEALDAVDALLTGDPVRGEIVTGTVLAELEQPQEMP